jgi:hypothetical protein
MRNEPETGVRFQCEMSLNEEVAEERMLGDFAPFL